MKIKNIYATKRKTPKLLQKESNKLLSEAKRLVRLSKLTGYNFDVNEAKKIEKQVNKMVQKEYNNNSYLNRRLRTIKYRMESQGRAILSVIGVAGTVSVVSNGRLKLPTKQKVLKAGPTTTAMRQKANFIHNLDKLGFRKIAKHVNVDKVVRGINSFDYEVFLNIARSDELAAVRYMKYYIKDKRIANKVMQSLYSTIDASGSINIVKVLKAASFNKSAWKQMSLDNELMDALNEFNDEINK